MHQGRCLPGHVASAADSRCRSSLRSYPRSEGYNRTYGPVKRGGRSAKARSRSSPTPTAALSTTTHQPLPQAPPVAVRRPRAPLAPEAVARASTRCRVSPARRPESLPDRRPQEREARDCAQPHPALAGGAMLDRGRRGQILELSRAANGVFDSGIHRLATLSSLL
jgi:hypothetical protein